jgi:hypothetical protein
MFWGTQGLRTRAVWFVNDYKVGLCLMVSRFSVCKRQRQMERETTRHGNLYRHCTAAISLGGTHFTRERRKGRAVWTKCCGTI